MDIAQTVDLLFLLLAAVFVSAGSLSRTLSGVLLSLAGFVGGDFSGLALRPSAGAEDRGSLGRLSRVAQAVAMIGIFVTVNLFSAVAERAEDGSEVRQSLPARPPRGSARRGGQSGSPSPRILSCHVTSHSGRAAPMGREEPGAFTGLRCMGLSGGGHGETRVGIAAAVSALSSERGERRGPFSRVCGGGCDVTRSGGIPVIVNERVRETLEIDKILEKLARQCRTPWACGTFPAFVPRCRCSSCRPAGVTARLLQNAGHGGRTALGQQGHARAAPS
jgi:hypothetical protein